MNFYNATAQAIGIVAMFFNIISYQQRTQKGAITCQLFGGALFAINFFMLGAIIGAIMNFIAIFRAIIFLNKKKLGADKPIWIIGFIIIYILVYIITFTYFNKEVTFVNIVLELLPIIGMTATTISFRLKDAGSVRKYGLISSPSWLIYNIANFAIGAIICEVLSLGSILIGMFRLDRAKK